MSRTVRGTRASRPQRASSRARVWSATALLVTCEHATNRVPPGLKSLFRPHRSLLDSHRGVDFGALGIAEVLSAELAAPLHLGAVSRLVIDLNRSLHHPRVFSTVTRALPPAARQEFIDRYYLPYRHSVESALSRLVGAGERVLHCAVHSFVPELDGKRRDFELGFLYDPARPSERTTATAWKQTLSKQHGAWRVRLNRPYLGISDGFTTYLRTRFPDGCYAGIEIEVNQAVIRRRSDEAAVAKRLTEVISLRSRGEGPDFRSPPFR